MIRITSAHSRARARRFTYTTAAARGELMPPDICAHAHAKPPILAAGKCHDNDVLLRITRDIGGVMTMPVDIDDDAQELQAASAA